MTDRMAVTMKKFQTMREGRSYQKDFYWVKSCSVEDLTEFSVNLLPYMCADITLPENFMWRLAEEAYRIPEEGQQALAFSAFTKVRRMLLEAVGKRLSSETINRLFVNDLLERAGGKAGVAEVLAHPRVDGGLLDFAFRMNEERTVAYEAERERMRTWLVKNPKLPLPVKALHTDLSNVQSVAAWERNGVLLRPVRKALEANYPDLMGLPLSLVVEVLAGQPAPASRPVPEKWKDTLLTRFEASLLT